MTFVERILTELKKTPYITATVFVNQEGEVIGHFGLKDPAKTGQLAIFLDSMGKQVGDTLSVSPVLSCNVELGDQRFITFIYKRVHFGIITSKERASKNTISTIKKAIESCLG